MRYSVLDRFIVISHCCDHSCKVLF